MATEFVLDSKVGNGAAEWQDSDTIAERMVVVMQEQKAAHL